jgi:hypothetical protein
MSEAYQAICPTCRDSQEAGHNSGIYQGPGCTDPSGNDATADWILQHMAEFGHDHNPVILDSREAEG